MRGGCGAQLTLGATGSVSGQDGEGKMAPRHVDLQRASKRKWDRDVSPPTARRCSLPEPGGGLNSTQACLEPQASACTAAASATERGVPTRNMIVASLGGMLSVVVAVSITSAGTPDM